MSGSSEKLIFLFIGFGALVHLSYGLTILPCHQYNCNQRSNCDGETFSLI